MSKFLRTARLEIRIPMKNFSDYGPPILLRGLRIAFSIQKNLSWSTNSAIIKVWNLSQDHRNVIKDYGLDVSLYAGYSRGAGEQLLFRGDTTNVSHYFDLPEIITVLECGDGERFANQKHFSLSYAAQTPVSNILVDVANKMGVNLILPINTNNIVYKNSFQFSGMLKEALQKVCTYANLQWSIQNGNLQIIPMNGTIIQPAYPINSETGMVGIPQRFTYKRQDFFELGPPIGWKVNTLLDPLIIPGYRLNISSRYLGFEGIFRVETIRHNGDTYGAEWTSQIEVTQLET